MYDVVEQKVLLPTAVPQSISVAVTNNLTTTVCTLSDRTKATAKSQQGDDVEACKVTFIHVHINKQK